jgi:hypothetical protein
LQVFDRSRLDSRNGFRVNTVESGIFVVSKFAPAYD